MRGNSFGKLFSITSFGESHGAGLGCVIDGIPAGLKVSMEELQKQLSRRAPGQSAGTTSRKEADAPEILSGVFEGKTLGTPIAVLVRNTNQRSQDYDKLKQEYRPGHADKTTMAKYGIRDHRGGGRSSGRETLARVIGGYFASLIIPKIKARAYITQMGALTATGDVDVENPGKYQFPGIDESEVEKYLVNLKSNGESCGGKISLEIDHVPAGLGEPAFDKLKSDLAKAIMSIGAVVGVSLGAGDEFANSLGSVISKNSSNFGGIEGGISNGEKIKLNILIKPTSTVGEKAKEGRHDPCIMPRAIPVIESMAIMTIADHFLRQQAYQL